MSFGLFPKNAAEGSRLPDENGSRDDGGPESFLVADGGLGDVLRADDLVRELVDLLLLVPALVGIELQSQRGCEHLGRQFLGVVARDVLALAKAVMLGQVSIKIAIAGD